MESLTDQAENMKPKKAFAPQDRVTLGKPENQKLEEWLKQIEDKFQGFIKVNKSDLVNFLITEHSADLSKDELEALKLKNYDEAKLAQWLLHQIKEGRKRGEDLKIEDLMKAHKPARIPKTQTDGGTIKKPKRKEPPQDVLLVAKSEIPPTGE